MEAGPSQNFNVEVHNQYPLPQKDFVIPLSNGATFIHPPFSAGYIVWTFPNNPSPARSTAVFVSKLLCNSKSSPMSAQTVEQLSGPHGYAYEPAALVAAENSSFAHGFTRENSVATVSDVNASVWSQFSFCNTENSVSHLHVLRGMKIVERNERPKYIGDESEEAENACTICLENLCTGVVVKTNCRHCFHKSCAYQSELHGLRSTGIWACPVCRDTVTWINLETLWQDGSKQNIDTSMESKKSNNRFKAMISRSGMLNSLVSAIAAVDTLSIFSETQPSSFIPIEPPVGMQHNTDSQSMMDKAYNLEVPMQVQRVPLDHKMFAENAESSEASKEPEYDQCCDASTDEDKDLNHVSVIVTSVSVASSEIFAAFQAVNMSEVVPVRQAVEVDRPMSNFMKFTIFARIVLAMAVIITTIVLFIFGAAPQRASSRTQQ